MFNRKKEAQPTPPPDYTKWEQDFGFLNLILTRKKNITKEYLIGIYQKQKSASDYLTDEEIQPIVEDIIQEVINQIGTEYKQFLINKYFGSLENLVRYVSEDVFVDLTSDAIQRNVKKIMATVQRNLITSLRENATK